jgi:hypothetical protein
LGGLPQSRGVKPPRANTVTVSVAKKNVGRVP